MLVELLPHSLFVGHVLCACALFLRHHCGFAGKKKSTRLNLPNKFSVLCGWLIKLKGQNP
jgi:hypothetical protein